MRRLALALLLVTCAVAPGCARPRRARALPDPALARWTGAPPGPAQVRQAAAWLHDELVRRYPPWPEGMVRSRDFPALPLVDVLPVQDGGRWGLDTGLLQRTLEETVRTDGLLRLAADEQAVPDFLREAPAEPAAEGEAAAPAEPSLVLQGWAAADGKFHLVLRRRARGEEDERLVTVESGRAEGF